MTLLNDILFDNCRKSRDLQIHVDNMIDVLYKMVDFFAANVAWNVAELAMFRAPAIPMLRQLYLGFTSEEKLWLQNKFDLVQVIKTLSALKLYLYTSRESNLGPFEHPYGIGTSFLPHPSRAVSELMKFSKNELILGIG